MPYPRSKKKVEKTVLETLALEEQAGKLLLQIDANKKDIQSYFDETGEKELSIVVEGMQKSIVKCKKVERVTLKYDVDKLKQQLDDDVFVEVTQRNYKIKDIDAMIKLMKTAGIKPKDFKALIDVDVVPLKTEIKRLYDLGEITMKQLKGTFVATISKTIKISEETGDKD